MYFKIYTYFWRALLFLDMNKIKEVLEQKGIKQTWLAEQLGKSYNMVNSYVQNRQQPRLEVLNDIAKILDVDVVELIVSSKKKWVSLKKANSHL